MDTRQPPTALPLQAEYTVQQVAEWTGLSEHTLRYYERAGLVEPVRRGSGGHRRYSAEQVARFEALACLRGTGMPLDQMRRYFELIPAGAAAAAQQQALLSAHQQVLEERMAQMQRHMAYLDQKIAYWRAIELEDPAAAAAIARRISGSLRAEGRARLSAEPENGNA